MNAFPHISVSMAAGTQTESFLVSGEVEVEVGQLPRLHSHLT
jgi:hypothetical protein